MKSNFTNPYKNLFSIPEICKKSSDKYVRYYSPERVDMLVNLIIVAAILALLGIPMIVLSGMSFSN